MLHILGITGILKGRLKYLVDSYEHLSERLVFISDGASWIHKWQKSAYPKATQILDFYHACEHLAAFAQTAISDQAQRKKWLDDRKTELLDSNYNAVSKNIKDVAKGKSKTVQREKEKRLNYYQKTGKGWIIKTFVKEDSMSVLELLKLHTET